MPCFSKVAAGNINPARFVKFGTTDGVVLECAGSATKILGISGPNMRNPPLTGLDDGYHAIAGENCQVFGDGEAMVPLQLGGTVVVGDKLCPTTGGVGIATVTDHVEYGAIAHRAGVSGEIIPVQVVIGGQISL